MAVRTRLSASLSSTSESLSFACWWGMLVPHQLWGHTRQVRTARCPSRLRLHRRILGRGVIARRSRRSSTGWTSRARAGNSATRTVAIVGADSMRCFLCKLHWQRSKGVTSFCSLELLCWRCRFRMDRRHSLWIATPSAVVVAVRLTATTTWPICVPG